jgi:hypothetical protein
MLFIVKYPQFVSLLSSRPTQIVLNSYFVSDTIA